MCRNKRIIVHHAHFELHFSKITNECIMACDVFFILVSIPTIEFSTKIITKIHFFRLLAYGTFFCFIEDKSQAHWQIFPYFSYNIFFKFWLVLFQQSFFINYLTRQCFQIVNKRFAHINCNKIILDLSIHLYRQL